MQERTTRTPRAQDTENAKDGTTVDTFGGWSFHPRNRTLTHPLAARGWYVDLDRCQTALELADWRQHVSLKCWANPPVVSGLERLVRALWRKAQASRS